MMNSKVSMFLKLFKNIVEQNQKFQVFTRGIEFQRKALDELELLQKRGTKLKQKMIRNEDEESSNVLLSLENLLDAYINEIKMLIFLKEDKMDKAWESLVTAQMSLRASFQANDIVESFNGNNYLQRLLFVEKLFFPKQTFMSIGGVIESSKCSICGQGYGTCTHVKGRPYMGKICCEIITKIKDMREVSIVDEPGNKMCRVTEFSDNNSWRDILTWRIVKGPQKASTNI